MFIPILMILIAFGTTPFLIHGQETPPRAMTEEQIMESSEYKDLMQAQEAVGNFTGDENSKEFKTLMDNFQQKQDAFNKIIPRNFSSQENSEPAPEQQAGTAETQISERPTEGSDLGPVKKTEETAAAESEQAAAPEPEPTPESESMPAPQPEPSSEESQPAPDETTSEEIIIEEAPAEPVVSTVEEQEVLISEEEPLSEEPVGIDTVSLENPQGNWLFKRIWWERAEERYEKIRNLVDAIFEQRNTFFKERNQLDRNILDPFYMSIGIDRGELQIILSEITDFLEQQREQQGELSEQERVLYETYVTEEETLKQLKRDVDMISSLDQAIDDALGTFMNQINRVKNYEAEAWKNFKEIAHILNDTRARELYYMIEGAARNIKTISTYLEQEFFTHFHKLIEEAQTRVARVQSQMEALKEKGVLFQRQAEQLEQQQTAAEDQEDEDDEEESKPKPKVGWIDWMVGGVSDVFSYIWSIIRMPYDMIFGK